MTRLTKQEYWDNSYKNIKFKPDNRKSSIIKIINKNFKSGTGKTVLEIGCFPGRTLFYFGLNGYEINGIDYSIYLDRLKEWFENKKFKIGKFEKADIDRIKIDKKYDIVFSRGFIEHFSDYKEKIKKHIEATQKNGYILITTPNFSGKIQKFLHKICDKETLDKHYLPATDYKNWIKTFEENNCSIEKSGYFGGFDFWIDKPNMSKLGRVILMILYKLFKTPLFRCLPNNKMWSPTTVMIAKKH